MRVLALMMGGMLLGGTSTALAQDRQFGVKAGVNVAATEFSGDAAGGYDERRIGAIGGAFAVFRLQPRLALQVEALYSQKGSKVTVDEDNAVTLELEYLDLPVLARIDIAAWESNGVHVFAGPSVGYRLSANTRLSNTAFDFANGTVVNIEDDIARFDLGLVVGAGADIGRRLVVDARYTWGLNNVNKDSSDGVQVKNRVLSVMAGIRF